jgi:hypothetical protein
MEEANVTLILRKIREIKKEITYIKAHRVDVDRILTDEEIIMLNEAEKEFDEKKTINLEEITRGSE